MTQTNPYKFANEIFAILFQFLPETTLAVQEAEALVASLAAHSALYLIHSPRNTIQSKTTIKYWLHEDNIMHQSSPLNV